MHPFYLLFSCESNPIAQIDSPWVIQTDMNLQKLKTTIQVFKGIVDYGLYIAILLSLKMSASILLLNKSTNNKLLSVCCGREVWKKNFKNV